MLLADLTPAAAVFLGVSAAGVVSIPALLFADAVAADFDPRPVVRRAIESGRYDPVLITVGPMKADARRAAARARRIPRDAAISAAALLALLTTPKGTPR
jgi:hypothetical protein